ncbi:MAG: carboxypeptidase regulatory-like domain-containing protein [Bacteroides sp.]|nr:carboxypeptidase regulatory-like domain-containing protein [Bacteroides sp.]
MKKVILILTILIVSLSSYARDIKGRIVDEQGNMASVIVLSVDSTLVSSSLTDENGVFFSTDEGKFHHHTLHGI